MPGNVVQFLSLGEVTAIQNRLIDRFGGERRVRERGLLASVLFRPQTGCHTHIQKMAAAMFESLRVNHAFVDGNKRVRFFAIDVLLRLNGWKLSVSAGERERFVIGVLDNHARSFENVLAWIRSSIVRM